MNILIIVAGIILLVAAGELLVRGAVNIALRFHISTLVVGMTVVSFGTSAPELLVSLEAMFTGHPGIAVGNVIGSNVANIALVLGVTAMVLPIQVDKNSYRIDWPMLALSTMLLYGFLWLNFDYALYDEYVTSIKWFNGVIMVGGLISFSYFLIKKSRKTTKANIELSGDVPDLVSSHIVKDLAFISLGSVGLSYGAHLLVNGTVGLASALGISDYVISVTVVALGTSLPELMTSVMAALKKHSDLSVGNLIGSNIFNIMGILGITSIFKEIPVSQTAMFDDMPWLIGITILLFPMMITRKSISRVEGMLLFGIYVIYIILSVGG